MPLVDAHVHAFPDRLALAVRGQLNRGGLLEDGPLLADVVDGVRTDGFAAAWVLPYAHRSGVAEGVNEWSAAEVGRFPGLVPGATFHPEDANLADLVTRALVDLALRVVKLHCNVGDFSITDPRLEPLWRAAEERRVPVVAHVGRRSPGETAVDEIAAVASILRAHPGLPFIVAHAGYPNVEATLALMDSHPSLYADVTPVWQWPVDVRPADLERLAGRLLFGSDAPNNPARRSAQVARWRALGAPGPAVEALLGSAAAELVPL